MFIMRYLLIFIFLLTTNILVAQKVIFRDSPVTIRNLSGVETRLQHTNDFAGFDKLASKLKYVEMPNIHIKNAAMRFAIGNIELSESNDVKLNNAVNVLLDYVKNDSVRNMVNYIKSYITKSNDREVALKRVKNKLSVDSVNTALFHHNRETCKGNTYNTKDLRKLVSFIDKDSVYMWMKEASRDSVQLSIKNSTNDSISMWINSGRVEFYRFWIKNSHRDSIGAWIQTIPGKSLRIIVDNDVYQQSIITEKKALKEVYLKENLQDSYWKIGKLYPHKKYRNYWQRSAIFNLGFTQGYIGNWAGGGESSISGLFDVDAYANYNTEKINWENKLGYRYGLMKIGEEDDFRKNEDLLEVETKLGVKAIDKWYYSTYFSMKTQFFNGFNYPDREQPISSLFAPGYFMFSVGMDYKPSGSLSVLISPLTGKYTIVADTNKIDQTKYGIDKDKKIKKETGAYIKGTQKWNITSDIKLLNEVGFFTNYEENPQNIDVNWKMTLEMKVNYFITTKIFTHMVYDDDVMNKLQFKEILSIGISYRL